MRLSLLKGEITKNFVVLQFNCAYFIEILSLFERFSGANEFGFCVAGLLSEILEVTI